MIAVIVGRLSAFEASFIFKWRMQMPKSSCSQSILFDPQKNVTSS